MEGKRIPEVMLNSRHKMPMVGFGTVFAPLEGFAAILVDAIRADYRHFDTASSSSYGTEGAVGQAFAEGLDQRLINRREDLFVTSKLWCSDAHPHLVLPALTTTLQ